MVKASLAALLPNAASSMDFWSARLLIIYFLSNFLFLHCFFRDGQSVLSLRMVFVVAVFFPTFPFILIIILCFHPNIR